MGDRNTFLFGSVFVLATAGIAADYVVNKPDLPPVVSSGAAPVLNKCGLAAPCAPAAAKPVKLNPCGM